MSTEPLDPDPIRAALSSARAADYAAKADARAYTSAAIAAGQSEYQVARDLGVTRMTVRSWLGKTHTGGS